MATEFTCFSSTVTSDIGACVPFLMRFQIVSALLAVDRVPAYRTLAGFVSEDILELGVADI